MQSEGNAVIEWIIGGSIFTMGLLGLCVGVIERNTLLVVMGLSTLAAFYFYVWAVLLAV